MKTVAGIVLTLMLSFSAHGEQSINYKLKTVASYLNFYLLNLNACEDFHPAVRKDALEAEKLIYPWLEALNGKIELHKLNDKEKADIAKNALTRRASVNQIIAENELTVAHCQAIIDIVKSGLDVSLLQILK